MTKYTKEDIANYEDFNGLKIKCETTDDNGKKYICFLSTDYESVIFHTITSLYDGIVKRAKLKCEQYYKNRVEYCKIIATYIEGGYYTMKQKKVKYTIENWRNDWGNFIDVFDTFKDNNIIISKDNKD